MLTFQIPTESGNAAIKDGRLGRVLSETLDRLKPEAAYFTAMESGTRGGYIVFDLRDPSDIPWVCEPLFREFNATVDLSPVMTADDVAKGVAKAMGG
jgi:hypothetical protein